MWTMSGKAIYRVLGAAVAKQRKSLGLTQADLASRVGMTRASLANIETGRQSVLLHQVYEIADALGLEGIHTLAPDKAEMNPVVRTVPIDAASVTDVQRSQVERVVQLALGRSRSLERRSS